MRFSASSMGLTVMNSRPQAYTGLGLFSVFPAFAAPSKPSYVEAPHVLAGRQSPPKKRLYPIFEGSLNFIIKEFDEEGAVDGVTNGIEAYYFGARMYDPEVGIWQSVDPEEQFWNSYCYGALNPVLLWDPDGRRVPYVEEKPSTELAVPENQSRWNIGWIEKAALAKLSREAPAEAERIFNAEEDYLAIERLTALGYTLSPKEIEEVFNEYYPEMVKYPGEPTLAGKIVFGLIDLFAATARQPKHQDPFQTHRGTADYVILRRKYAIEGSRVRDTRNVLQKR